MQDDSPVFCVVVPDRFAAIEERDHLPRTSESPDSHRPHFSRSCFCCSLHTGGGRFLPLRQVHWNLLRLVKDQVILIELVTGPERSTRQQVKKLGVTHRFIVVTQRCAKDPSPVIFVGPDTDLLISFFTILCRG